jgi:hypothetical protein
MGRSAMERCSPSHALARLYGAYALIFLIATLLSGTWLRAVFVWPASLAGYSFAHLVHAHSHLALFGWVTPALFALVVAGLPLSPHRSRWLTGHAHLLGVASALSFPGFLHLGYAPATIALATLHVALWAAFAFLCWRPLLEATSRVSRFYRVAIGFLALAGAAAMAPGFVEAKGMGSGALQIALQLFLTPFTAGWLTIGAFGVAYARMRGSRFATPVLVLSALGVLPSVAAHVPGAVPHLAWEVTGRLGMAALGIATLLFAADALRARGLAPLFRLAGGAALLKGAVETGFALGFATSLLGSKHLVVGYLHLVLLGIVTCSLLGALVAPLRAPRLVALHGVGLTATLVALGFLGLPGGYDLLYRLGGSGPEPHRLALAGGALSLFALSAMIALLVHTRLRQGAAAEAVVESSSGGDQRSAGTAASLRSATAKSS